MMDDFLNINYVNDYMYNLYSEHGFDLRTMKRRQLLDASAILFEKAIIDDCEAICHAHEEIVTITIWANGIRFRRRYSIFE